MPPRLRPRPRGQRAAGGRERLAKSDWAAVEKEIQSDAAKRTYVLAFLTKHAGASKAATAEERKRAWDSVPPTPRRWQLSEEAILAIKVCDKACGSGHFLVGAGHRLARHLARVRALAQGESEPSPLLYQTALALGKYGLFPLTLEEADTVMGLVQSWFPDWSAAPVCYVDLPVVCRDAIYTETEIEPGMKRWLEVAAKNRVPVVLFDTAEKARGRRLMKDAADDKVGILTERQIHGIDCYARKLGIKALWAGGISLSQVLAFGRLKVFGIYVTSAAAVPRPLDASARTDPSLAAARRVTYDGVRNANCSSKRGSSSPVSGSWESRLLPKHSNR